MYPNYLSKTKWSCFVLGERMKVTILWSLNSLLNRLGFISLMVFILPPIAYGQSANDYPNRPIRIIVSFPPGGSPDFTARVIGQQIGSLLHTSVVVENKPGSGGNLGTQYVASSKPDGYTLLVNSSAFTVNPSLYGAKAGYDPEKDFSNIISFFFFHFIPYPIHFISFGVWWTVSPDYDCSWVCKGSFVSTSSLSKVPRHY